MKKFGTIMLGVLFVLCLAAGAYAITAEIPSDTQAAVAKGATQITISGEIRTRGELQGNTADFDSDIGDSYAAYDQRVRLAIDAKVTPNLIGRIHLETVNNDLDSASQDLYVWGNNRSYARGRYPYGNQKGTSLNILEAWIQYSGTGLFGVNSGLKVGHQPIKLGNGLFLDHSKYGDDAIVFFVEPAKDFYLAALTAKWRESCTDCDYSLATGTRRSDDSDAYVILGSYKFDKSVVSGDVTYINDQQQFLGAAGGTYLWNFALRGNFNIEPVIIRFDFDYQTGSARNVGGTNTDIDLTGMAGVLGVDFKIDPVLLTLEGAYGTGDKRTSERKNEAFITSLGADQHFTYVYEYRTVNACGNQYGGLCNTWYAKLGGSYDWSKEVASWLSVYYLGANKSLVEGQSKTIGWEVDAKVEWKIEKNLKYWVEGGYLFAGDFWEHGPNNTKDGAYALRHGLQLNF